MPVVYCVVPQDLGTQLHASLRSHFASRPEVRVLVERRRGDRRCDQSQDGLRIADRRVSALAIPAPSIPQRHARHRDRLLFVERLALSPQYLEDADTGRMVARIQAGEPELFGQLYMRYFDRVYGYLQVMLHDRDRAEDATQNVFLRVLEALPRYQRRSQPFRAWLFTIVRNHAIDQLRVQHRVEPMDDDELNRRRDAVGAVGDTEPHDLDQIPDGELVRFLERLPLAQRQALTLRFMLDLSTEQIAAVLDRSPADVRKLQSRGLQYLRTRLDAIGRARPHAMPGHA